MSFYSLALFAHILGVVAIFIVIGFEWASLLRLRSAQTVAQVQEYTSLIGVQEKLLAVGAVLLLIGGISMTTIRWGWGTPWIVVALVTLLMQAVIGVAVHIPRFKVIHASALASESSTGFIPAELERRITDPLLWLSVHTHGITALGVIFLMTNKPGLIGSLITIVVSLIISVISAQFWRPRQLPVSITEVRSDNQAEIETIR